MTTELKAGFKAMKANNALKEKALKKKKKFGKEVVRASKSFYKEMRMKRKAMTGYTKVMKQIIKKTKAAQAKAEVIKRTENIAKERTSPEKKLNALITKFALNVLNTSGEKELLLFRGIGANTASNLYVTRQELSSKKFANMKETGLSEEQVKTFIEGIVVEKLLF